MSVFLYWWYGICDLMSLQLLCWVYPGRNRRETSQRSFLVKASWHAPLICPLTKEKEEENWTQLRTETLFKELLNWKRVLALKTQIFDSISATVSASSSSISSNLSLDLLKQPGWDISPLDGACVTLMPAGDGCENCTLELSVGCLIRRRSFPGLCTDLK